NGIDGRTHHHCRAGAASEIGDSPLTLPLRRSGSLPLPQRERDFEAARSTPSSLVGEGWGEGYASAIRCALAFGAVAGESRLGLRQRRGGADMIPLAVMHDGGKPARCQRAVPQAIEREFAGLLAVEQPAMHDLHAGEEM